MKKNTAMTRIGITLTLLALSLSGCTGPGKTTKAAGPASSTSSISGKVLETMDAGGYTYLLLEKNGKSTWIAAPAMKADVGQELVFLQGAEMTQFSSKALNRTFDKIVFSSGLDQSAVPKAKTAVITQPLRSLRNRS